MLNKKNLMNTFIGAIKSESKYIALSVNIGLKQEEIIINTVENFKDGKFEYYAENYNTDLELNTNKKIKITGMTFGNDFLQIENDLKRNGHL